MIKDKYSMKQRDISIDILKFCAVLAITNSHMELLYGDYSFLATGGAIGDVLFFFASGYTLFLGRVKVRFDNYYKRRINRIYPTVFAWALLCSVFFNENRSMEYIVLYGGGWFVSCIMLYYIVLYFVKRYLINHLKLTLSLSLAVSASLYYCFENGQGFNMYGYTYYKWFHYFCFMLQGAIMGLLSCRHVVSVRSGWVEAGKAMFCVVLFYALCSFKSSSQWHALQVLSLIPLMGVSYYVYRLCNAEGVKRVYKETWMGLAMNAVSGLCLEVYLVQYHLFTDKLNHLFPLNLLIVFVEILLVAYVLRCMARIWSQTFKDGDYDWKAVVRVV